MSDTSSNSSDEWSQGPVMVDGGVCYAAMPSEEVPENLCFVPVTKPTKPVSINVSCCYGIEKRCISMTPSEFIGDVKAYKLATNCAQDHRPLVYVTPHSTIYSSPVLQEEKHLVGTLFGTLAKPVPLVSIATSPST